MPEAKEVKQKSEILWEVTPNYDQKTELIKGKDRHKKEAIPRNVRRS